MPQIGEPAPDFELPNQDGKLVRLSNFRGQKVILFAFPQAYTAGCTAQACGFRDSLPSIQAAGAVVLGISPDSPDVLKRWKQDKHLSYDLLSDQRHQILDQWHAWGIKLLGLVNLPRVTRSYWVIDENGVVSDAQVGISPSGSVERALKAVSG